MKDEYRLCLTRGADKSNRVARHMKTSRDRAEEDMKDYDTLLSRGLVNRVWVETRQVGEWRELHDEVTEMVEPAADEEADDDERD